MKHRLLISVAAIALVAGAQVASSQSTGPNVPGGPSAPAAQSPGPATAPSAPTGRTPDTQATPDTPSHGINKGDRGNRQDRATEAPSKGTPQQRATEQAPGKNAPQPRQTDRDTKGFPDQKQQTQGAPQPGAKQGDRGMTSRSVSLTTEQRTRIRSTVINTGPRASSVDFDVRVGIVVPRSVRVAPLPATIIEIQPDWRGYMYFVYEDEIIVVEPGTLRIVAVLEV